MKSDRRENCWNEKKSWSVNAKKRKLKVYECVPCNCAIHCSHRMFRRKNFICVHKSPSIVSIFLSFVFMLNTHTHSLFLVHIGVCVCVHELLLVSMVFARALCSFVEVYHCSQSVHVLNEATHFVWFACNSSVNCKTKRKTAINGNASTKSAASIWNHGIIGWSPM